MSQYVVTPWKWHSELLTVRARLYQLGEYAEPVDQRRHAVGEIAAWGIRGGLPHAVESTSLLMDAILSHEDAGEQSLTNVKLAYTAAFCRFVTGYCDISQKYGTKHSMYEIASELEMPAAFVELRHEATHDRIPSLPRLASNCKLALGWLWEHYWSRLDDPQQSNEEGVANSSASEADFRAILNSFLSQRKTEIKSGIDGTGQEGASAMTCVKIINICLGGRVALEALCSTLATQKMLIPSNRAMGDSMSGAFTIWGNLLRRLSSHQKRFIGVLVLHLTRCITSASGSYIELNAFYEAVSAWLMHVFSDQSWKHQEIAKRVEVRRNSVVEECSMAANIWAQKITKALVEGGDAQFKAQWSWVLTSEAMNQVEI